MPTPADPTFSLATPGPAPLGVPNPFIDNFRIPPFLLPIYQAAGVQYNVPWQVLAAINEIETDYGRNLSVSTAGAVGWMQFEPATFRQYGVDANNDGVKDPYNPVDAIFTAARYLHASGASKNLRGAIFAYNHATWYVNSVLLRAKLIGGLPAGLVGALTGLTEGRFPVAAKARYADDILERNLHQRVTGQNAALPISSSPTRHSIDIFAKPGAPVVAVNDGRVVRVGHNAKYGRFVELQDVYGNTYVYSQLASIAKKVPTPEEQIATPNGAGGAPALPKGGPSGHGHRGAKGALPTPASGPAAPPVTQQRLFANPSRPGAYRAGGRVQLERSMGSAMVSGFKQYFTQQFGLSGKDVVLRRLRRGSTVVAGTILGRIGVTQPGLASHVTFMLRPPGKKAPWIDPKPILDGWQLLQSTAIYRAAGKNPFFGPDAKNPSIGQALLLSKEQLERRVLADPRIQIYPCGQRDIKAGLIDRRVLASLEFLVASGLDPTVSSLHCGHSKMSESGYVSEHWTGDAADISAVNGLPILGHQGPGSITDLTVRRLLTLQGAMKPDQIIGRMPPKAKKTPPPASQLDHIHIGFHPLFGPNNKLGRQINAVLKPAQWVKLIGRLGQIDQSNVSTRPSRFAIPDRPGHRGD